MRGTTRAARPMTLLVTVLGLLLGMLVGTTAEAAPKPPKPPRPAVTKLTPAAGPVTGGTVVTVKGKNLLGARKVLFGKTKGTQLKVRSNRKLTVVAPAGVAGAVKVQVVSKGGKSKAGKVRFTYLGATVPPTTPPPVTPPPPVGLGGSAYAVDCWAPGSCFAVGTREQSTGVSVAAAYRLLNGTWTPTALPALPGSQAADPRAELDDISCPTTTFCAAVGSYLNSADHLQTLLLTWNGSTWTAASVLPAGLPADAEAALVGLDCVSAAFCAAVGGVSSDSTPAVNAPLGIAWKDATWSAQALGRPAGTSSAVVDIDCTAVDACLAVGRHEPSGQDAQPQPFVEALSGATWTYSLPALPPQSSGGALQAVSCVSTTACTAVGSLTSTSTADLPSLGLVMRRLSGAWSATAASPPADAESQPAMGLADVDCPTGYVVCWAVGAYRADRPAAPLGFAQEALVAQIYGPGASPSVTSELVAAPVDAAANTVGFLRAIVCSVGSSCMAVGSYSSQLGPRPMTARVSGGPEPATSAPVPPGAAYAELVDVALDSATSAVGVGYAPGSGGPDQPLLLTGLQLPPEQS